MFIMCLLKVECIYVYVKPCLKLKLYVLVWDACWAVRFAVFQVGAPPEIASFLDEIRRENDLFNHDGRVSTCLGDDPELDIFMVALSLSLSLPRRTHTQHSMCSYVYLTFHWWILYWNYSNSTVCLNTLASLLYIEFLPVQETYCDILVKYKSDLSRPFDEAKTFLNKIETQLSNLCKGSLTHSSLFFYLLFFPFLFWRSWENGIKL